MGINKIRRRLFKLNRILGDVNAVQKGKEIQRVENRILGRLNNWLMRKIWRR